MHPKFPPQFTSAVSTTAAAAHNRVYGKYRGIVKEVENSGKITAIVPAVYGDEKSPWAMPAVPFAGKKHGLVLLPEEGDGVWIEFEGGDVSRPIWSGGWWASDQLPQQSGVGKRVLAATPGHRIAIDEDSDAIQISHPGGAEVTLEKSKITLKIGSCSIEISPKEISLNNGMIKVTTAGVSLVNDAMKFGA